MENLISLAVNDVAKLLSAVGHQLNIQDTFSYGSSDKV